MLPQDLFERLQERSAIALISLSADGTVTGWSRGAERLVGYSEPEVLGRAFSSLAEDPPSLERALGALRQSTYAHTVCLTTPLRKRDRQEPAFLCVDVLRDQPGQVEGFVVTLRDHRTVILEPAPEGTAGRLVVPVPGALQSLTPRQRTVLEMIARGYSTREIAKRLNRSVKTIETHRAQLMKRLNIYHVPGLVGFAIRTGLVTLE